MDPESLGPKEPLGCFQKNSFFKGTRDSSTNTMGRTGKKSFRKENARLAYLFFMGAVMTKKPVPEKRYLFVWIFLAALVLSLLVHLLFFEKARSWRVAGFSPEGYDEIVPRTFRMKRVEIDPKTLEEQAPEPVKKTAPQPIRLEKETPMASSAAAAGRQESLLAKPTESLPAEKPAGGSETQGALHLGKGMGLENAAQENPGIDTPDTSKETALLTKALDEKISAAEAEGEGGGEGGKGTAKPGFSSLDDLLARSGVVTPATAPILMPTDLLFEYDAASLRPEAAQSLTKLGYLIEKNSGATFRIEGHTDAFGTDAYNQALSMRRAEEVRAWLAKNIGIDPARITTVGFGKSRLLVPGTGSVAEQQLNRRVEIVITARNP